MYLFIPYGNDSAVYDHPATDDPAPKSDGLGPPIKCAAVLVPLRLATTLSQWQRLEFGAPPEIRTQT